MAWKGGSDIKRKLPLLTDKVNRFSYNKSSIKVDADKSLTVIYQAIKCKTDPLKAGENIQGLDRIEIESLWITKYMDINELKSDTIPGRNKLQEFIDVLIRTLPVQAIVRIENRKNNRKGLEKLKNKTIREAGITSDALAVYVEFYRSYLNYHTEG